MNDIYLTGCTDPYRNLAAEELLTEMAAENVILFLWQNENTIVIGRNQDAFAECRVQEFLADGGRIVRRNSGGGAVYHDTGNLNFSFIASAKEYDVSRQLSVIARAAASFGIKAEVSGRNDLTANGRKFSGNAFYDNGKRKLHHGTILIGTDPEKVGRYLTPDSGKLAKRGIKSVSARVAPLASLCEDITPETMRDAVIRAFMEEYVPAKVCETLPPEVTERLDSQAATYASESRIFGTKKGFSEMVRIEDENGVCTVHFSSRDGIITDAAVFTDSMDPAYAGKLREKIIGRPAGQLQEIGAAPGEDL